MSSPCADLQRRLTLEGPSSMADDPAAQQHLATCEECFAILEGLHELEGPLTSLPPLEPPQAWVDGVFGKIAQEPLEILGEGSSRWWQSARNLLEPLARPAVRQRLAAVVVVGLATALLVTVLLQPSPRRYAGLAAPREAQVQARSEPPATERATAPQGQEVSETGSALEDTREVNRQDAQDRDEQNRDAKDRSAIAYQDVGGHPENRHPNPSPPPTAPDAAEVQKDGIAGFFASYRRGPREGEADNTEDPKLGPESEVSKNRSETPGKSQALPKQRLRTLAPPPPPPRPRVAGPPVPDPSPEQVLSEAEILSGRQRSEGSTLYSVDFTDASLEVGPSGASGEVDEILWPLDVTVVSEAPAKYSGNVFSGSISADSYDLVDGKTDAQIKGHQIKGKANGDTDANLVTERETLAAGISSEYGASSSAAGKKEVARTDDEPHDIALGESFLAERQQTQGLSFRDPTGYWRNTYIPGDPVLRLLSSRLIGPDRARSEKAGTHKAGTHKAAEQRDSLTRLHDEVRRPGQPFDPPDGAALGLALSADQRAVSGETRVLLQVGLQATSRRAGRRPPLDVALVLDLTGSLSEGTEASMRALSLALCRARRSGDRFRLIVAGRPGGILVDPDFFRFGTLQVTLDQLFGAGGSTAPTLDLPAALRAGLETLQREDQPGSPLGSSILLLATPRAYGGQLPGIERIAHAAAVASVPLSPIGIGDQVERGELDRLAIAGQGNRRLLTRASGAPSLVDREISAASRAVARAVRLSIRLAPGVRLVDVVGSQSLDQLAAQRVRDAEQSVDQKIARSMGIAADRGEDEEGIQIVIPSFLAGDAHVVMLDLVVPGPGAVADVRLRFKDLVQSRNGVSAAHLELAPGSVERGPLELNVLHNLLVLRLVDTLDQAGKAVATGQIDLARRLLEDHLSRLRGLERLLPSLGDNREMAADRTLLVGYLEVLSSDEISQQALRRLSDSLRYAARLKVLPEPEKTEP